MASVLELMYAGCDSRLIARVCWLPPPQVAPPSLPKWRAIPLDHRLKSLLRPGGGEEKEQKGEEQEGEKVEEEVMRRSQQKHHISSRAC